jgi:multiple sugar transport system substrate-binding protein
MTVKDEKGVIKQAGVSLGRTENVDNWQEILALMMIQNGVDLKNPTGDSAVQALKFYSAFSSQYGVWNETLPSSTIAFASGKLAMYIGPSWRAHEIRQQNPTLKFRVVPVPQLPKASTDDPDVAYATYWVEGVNSQSKVSVEAWKFLKFLSEKESLTKMYKNASSVRAFGALYPRRDMQDLIASDPLVNGVIATATNSKSWYLASRTFDGQSGINSQLSKYFEDAVNSMNGTGAADPNGILSTAAAGVQSVLVQFRLIAAPPAVKK